MNMGVHMKKLAMAAAALTLALPANAAVELVKNGSFESSSVGAGQKVKFAAADVADWTGGYNLTFVAAPGTADDHLLWLDVYGPFPYESPVGGNFVLADADPAFSGVFSQSISGLTVGKTYELNFWQAAGQQAGWTGPTTEQWEVTFGDTTKLSDLFSLPEAGVGPWEKQTMTFTATSTTQLLSFLAKGTPGGAPPISFLDGVSLQEVVPGVPEPATWAMLLVGFGAVGFAARRRTTTATA